MAPLPSDTSSAPRPEVGSGLIDHLVPVDVSAPVKYIALILLTLVVLGALVIGMALRTGRRTHVGTSGGLSGGAARDRNPGVDAAKERLDNAERTKR